MTHDDLIAEWERDSHIDRTKLQNSIYNIPMLHAKYLKYLQDYKLRVRKLVMQFDSMKDVRTRYYNGELTKEELDHYEWKQFQLVKPTKARLDTLLAGDENLQLIVEKIEYIKILIETTESILKEIHQLGYLVKTIVDLQKFEAGVM